MQLLKPCGLKGVPEREAGLPKARLKGFHVEAVTEGFYEFFYEKPLEVGKQLYFKERKRKNE